MPDIDAQQSEPPVPHKSEMQVKPPTVYKPSKMRYVFIILILFLVLSVVGVGAYIIDSENRALPSQLNVLLTPTPDIPGQNVTPHVKPTVTQIATPSGSMASSSAEESASASANE